LRKSCIDNIEEEISEDSMLELASFLDSPTAPSQPYLPDYPDDGNTTDLNTLSGKLKNICLTLYASLTSLELDLIDNLPQLPLGQITTSQKACSSHFPSQREPNIRHPSAIAPSHIDAQTCRLHTEITSETSLNPQTSTLLPYTLSSSLLEAPSPSPTTTLNLPINCHMVDGEHPPTTPHILSYTQEMGSTNHQHSDKENTCLSGQSELEPGAHTLEAILDSLLPSYKEITTPTPLPTYLGPTLHKFLSSNGMLGSIETTPANLGKEYTWSRGHGFEHSPIKIPSARHKEGNTIDIGALRGMKYLARAKP
jgi:hypothetical protein